MPLPFTPRWTHEIFDELPDPSLLCDAPRTIERLEALGFRRVGVECSRGIDDLNVCFEDAEDDREMRDKWVDGEASTLLLSADGHTLAQQSTTFRCLHLRFTSLLENGTVVQTRRCPDRGPETTLPDDGLPERDADVHALDPQVKVQLDALLAWLVGRTEDGVYPDFPLSGLRERNLPLDPAELWNAHAAHLAGRRTVSLEDRALQTAMQFRRQHIQVTHVDLVLKAERPYTLATWLPVFLPPMLALWFMPVWWMLGLGLLWVGCMFVLGRNVLLVMQTYWVLTPLLRWWPFPRRVPADQLVAGYHPTLSRDAGAAAMPTSLDVDDCLPGAGTWS